MKTKQRERSPQIYAAAGIPEYWVINLRTMQPTIWRSPSDEGYQSKETLTQGEINPLAFPDLAVSVDRLLR